MKMLTLFLFAIFLVTNLKSQNIVQNPSFDSNLEPTFANQIHKASGWSKGCSFNYGPSGPFAATLLSQTSPYFGTDLPIGFYAINERLAKPTNQRKIALIATRGNIGSENSDNYGNSLIGSFTSGLIAGETYNFCLWAWTGNQSEKLQIVLRKNGDCVKRRLVYTTPSFLVLNQWQNITGSFTVTPQDIIDGFDKFEIRGFEPLPDPGGNGIIYLDDIHMIPNSFLGPDITVCNNAIPQIDAGSIGTNYKWYKLPDLVTVISTQQTYTPITSGTYQVDIVDGDFGCDRTDQISVTVVPCGDSQFCCEETNLINNGSFELGNSGFISDYNFNDLSQLSTNPFKVGDYTISNSTQANTVCNNWNVEDHTYCINSSNSNFLLVNGETQQNSNQNNVIWQTQQPIQVKRDSQYRFCAYVNHLPQCCFDIIPRIRIEIKNSGSSFWSTILNWNLTAYTGTNSPPCDWEEISASFTAFSPSVEIRILIEEIGNGDGNDLAIDDISLTKKPQQKIFFSLSNRPKGNPNYFELEASMNSPGALDDNLPSSDCQHLWLVSQVADLNNPLSTIDWATTEIGGTHPFGATNPSWGLTTNFPNYNGGTPSGNFEYQKKYVVIFGIFNCSCHGDNFNYQTFSLGRRFSKKRKKRKPVALKLRTSKESVLTEKEKQALILEIESKSKE